MDIFKEIKKEHDEFRKITDEINETTDRAIKTRETKFKKFFINITAHHESEEVVLVPKLKEKKETREMEERLVQYFREKDIQGAKQYFLNCLAVRPDVLMEASDVYGDLKAAMQVIATAEYEMDAQGSCILDQCSDFQTLTEMFKELDAVMERQASGVPRPEDDTFLEQQRFSPEAIMIARKIAEKM